MWDNLSLLIKRKKKKKNEAVWISGFKFFSELFSLHVHYLITCYTPNGNCIWGEEEKHCLPSRAAAPIPLGAVVGMVLSLHYQAEQILGWKPTSLAAWLSLCWVQPLPWDLRPVRAGGFDRFSLHILPAFQVDPWYQYFCAPQLGLLPPFICRFFESLSWERSLSPTIASAAPRSPQNHVPKCHSHVPWTLPGMVIRPLPWTACSCLPVKNSFLNFISAFPTWDFETTSSGSYLLCFFPVCA